MRVSLCYLKVPCAAQPRAHGGGTSLCSKLRARGNAVLEQPVGGTSVPFPCPSANLLTTKKSRITTVLSLNAALSESETSIRAIYLLANLRGEKKKKRQLPQGGCCSSQMGGQWNLFQLHMYFPSRNACERAPLCRAAAAWCCFATSRGSGGPCWKMELDGHGIGRGKEAATFQLRNQELRIMQKRLEKTLLISSDFTASRFFQGAEPQLLNSKITLRRAQQQNRQIVIKVLNLRHRSHKLWGRSKENIIPAIFSFQLPNKVFLQLKIRGKNREKGKSICKNRREREFKEAKELFLQFQIF